MSKAIKYPEWDEVEKGEKMPNCTKCGKALSMINLRLVSCECGYEAQKKGGKWVGTNHQPSGGL